MSKLSQSVGLTVALWRLVARYPAVSSGIFQVIVVLGAAFGLHLTTTQLASGASFIAAVFGLLVHAGVIPVTKVDNVKAGIKPAVKGKASVLSTPMDGAAFAAENKPADPPRNPWKGN